MTGTETGSIESVMQTKDRKGWLQDNDRRITNSHWPKCHKRIMREHSLNKKWAHGILRRVN